jgi:hypothetical protein
MEFRVTPIPIVLRYGLRVTSIVLRYGGYSIVLRYGGYLYSIEEWGLPL